MTDNVSTATVTIQDLIASYQQELDDLRDAYEETQDHIQDEYGDDALDQPPEGGDDEGDPDKLEALQQQCMVMNEQAKLLQSRIHALESLRDDHGPAEFSLKMLSGSELMDIETELRMQAQSAGVDPSVLQSTRQRLAVDAAVVEAPDWVPRDSDGSPEPSGCVNPLTMALYEHVENLNNSGAVDFRAPGFDDEPRGVASGTSGVRKPSAGSLKPSDSTGENTRGPGGG